MNFILLMKYQSDREISCLLAFVVPASMPYLVNPSLKIAQVFTRNWRLI